MEIPMAFPSEQHETNDGTWNQSFDPGMSLRDFFASKAMQALISKLPPVEVNGREGCRTASRKEIDAIRVGISKSAYEYADAMLKSREQ